jgi:hypothetical protein
MPGNIGDVMRVFNTLRQNPMQILSRKFNIPQNINLQDPNAIIQHLLNSGQVSQSQVNAAMGARNDPFIQQIINNKRY